MASNRGADLENAPQPLPVERVSTEKTIVPDLSRKNQDHAAQIANVKWKNLHSAMIRERRSGALATPRHNPPKDHEADLLAELRNYEASGGALDAIRQHIMDKESMGAWDAFLADYRTGDGAAAEGQAGEMTAATTHPEAMNAKQEQPRSRRNFTELCKFRFNNGCRKGNNCPYAHSEEELRDFKPGMCRNFRKHGSCKWGDECRFFHGPSDRRWRRDYDFYSHEPPPDALAGRVRSSHKEIVEAAAARARENKKQCASRKPQDDDSGVIIAAEPLSTPPQDAPTINPSDWPGLDPYVKDSLAAAGCTVPCNERTLNDETDSPPSPPPPPPSLLRKRASSKEADSSLPQHLLSGAAGEPLKSPKKPRRSVKVLDADPGKKLKTSKDLDAFLNDRKCEGKVTWSVRATKKSNTEHLGATVPFLEAATGTIRNLGMQWELEHDYKSDKPHRGRSKACDVYLQSKEFCFVVECKSNNVMHGIGQVLHYCELQKKATPSLDVGKILALADKPKDAELLETAHKFGIRVWWPGQMAPLHPPDPDPKDAEIKRLQKKIQQLRNS